MLDEAVQKIMSLLNEKIDDWQTLFVGGCVRNWILNKKVYDIDLATKLPPDKVVEKLEKANIKVVPLPPVVQILYHAQYLVR